MAKLYVIRRNGRIWHVEATTFDGAVRIWREHNGGRWDPDEVVMIDSNPVIRGGGK